MLLLLGYHIIVTLLCLIIGFLFYSIINCRQLVNRPFIFYLISGLIIITVFSQTIALFFPINGYIFWGVVLLVILFSIRRKEGVVSFLGSFFQSLKTLPFVVKALMVCFWLMILVLNAGPTQMDDTESYHIQMIKWIHEYGTVPGIANLHERFGFNSSWFSSISFFLPSSNNINFYTALNGVISFWLSAYFIIRIFSSVQKEGVRISLLELGMSSVFILSILCWPMTRGNATTANYDFITTFLLIVLFVETIRMKLAGQKFSLEGEYILWPVYLFTVRIINYPLLLLSVLAIIILINRKQWKKIWMYAAISISLIGPFVARNIMLSGYPFYPAKFLNIFNVDWKVDENMQNHLLTFIKYFNRVNTMFMSIDETKQISSPSWIATWFHYLFKYDKMIVISGLLGSLLNILFLKRLRFAPIIQFFVIVLFLQLISWFFIAPDPRFAYGVFLCNIFFMFLLLPKTKAFLIGKTFFFSFCISASLIILSHGFIKIARNRNYQNFIVPVSLPQPVVREIRINNITLRIPEKVLNNWNPRCYATNLPCLYVIDPKLEPRGKSIKDGFRLHK